jgi:hypothetical protein
MNKKDKITLGYILSKYRLKYKLDIDQLAYKLSTDVDYIIALEKGNYKVFKTLNHAIPIIRKISYVLGLKYKNLVELYSKEYESYLDLQKQKSAIPKVVINHNILRFSIAFIVVAIIVGYVILQLYQIIYRPALVISNMPNYQIYNQEKYELVGKLNRANNLTLNGQKVTISEDGKFKILLNLRKGENRLELSVQKNGEILERVHKIIYRE